MVTLAKIILFLVVIVNITSVILMVKYALDNKPYKKPTK